MEDTNKKLIEKFELYLTYVEVRQYNMVKRFAYKIANQKSVLDAIIFMEFFIKPDLMAQGYYVT